MPIVAQTGSADPEQHLRHIAERASAHIQAGELDAAHVLYEQLLTLAPDHPAALNFIAIAALQSGDARRSVALLERAIVAEQTDAVLHKNLGLAYRAAGSLQAAVEAFRQAERLKPGFVVALLNEGALLTELGLGEEALAAYQHAFQAADRTGMFLDPTSMPAGVRVLAEKAVQVLRQARLQVLLAALAPIESRYGHAALVRVWQCLDTYLGRRAPIPLAPLQKPTLMSFPGLPGRAWFERSEFLWMQDIERRTSEIREELLAVLATDVGFRPFVEMPTEHPGAAYWRTVNHSPSWNAFFFYRDGERNTENSARCPNTTAALDSAPLIRIGGHSPESLYSVLQPGAHIPPHTGVVNCRLVVHLPLIIPPDCGIRVGSETRGWEEGSCIVFDDTFEHEAWNRSSHTRVVLIFDIWNPHLTEAEREGMRIATEALGEFSRKYNPETMA